MVQPSKVSLIKILKISGFRIFMVLRYFGGYSLSPNFFVFLSLYVAQAFEGPILNGVDIDDVWTS